MQNDEHPENEPGSTRPGFLTTLLQGMIRDTIGLWLTFLVGVTVGAIICLYYGVPLIFSLVGGLLVMAVYVAWDRL